MIFSVLWADMNPYLLKNLFTVKTFYFKWTCSKNLRKWIKIIVNWTPLTLRWSRKIKILKLKVSIGNLRTTQVLYDFPNHTQNSHAYIILHIFPDRRTIDRQFEHFVISRNYCWDRPIQDLSIQHGPCSLKISNESISTFLHNL